VCKFVNVQPTATNKCNLLQCIRFMLKSQTYLSGVKSSKNKINLHVLLSLFESLNHTHIHTLVRHNITLRPSYCNRHICISFYVCSHNFICYGVTDVKFLHREYMKVAKKELFLKTQIVVFVREYAIQYNTVGF